MSTKIVAIALSCCMTMASEIAYASPRAVPLSQRLAQREDCMKYDRTVEPSIQTKAIELKKFGIKIQIPQNFRTILTSKGEVWILNPVDYELLTCSTSGGIGGRGMYYSFIRSIQNTENLSLRTVVLKQYGSNSSTESLQLSNLSGLLAEETPGRGVSSSSFFVKVPGIKNIVEIGAGCDCDVKPENIKAFLKTVSLLRRDSATDLK